jgi:hypothetical protein
MNGFSGIGSGCVCIDGGLPQRNESALLVGQPEPDFPSGNRRRFSVVAQVIVCPLIAALFLKCANIVKSLAGAANYVTASFRSCAPKYLSTRSLIYGA